MRVSLAPNAEYTRGLSREAIQLIFKFLPRAYANGANDFEAREKVHYAATIAGMAFANAFLGICHSMAHKLGGFRLSMPWPNLARTSVPIVFCCISKSTSSSARHCPA